MGLAPSMAGYKEAEFGRWFTDVATQLSWNVCHWRTSAVKTRRGWVSILEGNTAKGFPDYVLVHVRTGQTMFVELKRDLGPKGGGDTEAGHRAALSPDQVRWRDAIVRGPNEYHLWRPADVDVIVARLSVPW